MLAVVNEIMRQLTEWSLSVYSSPLTAEDSTLNCWKLCLNRFIDLESSVSWDNVCVKESHVKPSPKCSL